MSKVPIPDGSPTHASQQSTDVASSQVSGEGEVSVEGQLRRLVMRKGGKFCERCKCCEMHWEGCTDCDGSGRYDVVGDDDGVLYLDGSRQCSKCSGCGGWWLCGCNDKGEHEERAK